MNRLQSLFESKRNEDGILNIYFTAGFPCLDDTLSILHALESSGADIIEVGIPFSDPLADGPTIQQSSERAIENGMTVDQLFQQLETLRPQSDIPVILMGYMNTVLQYGVDRFINTAARVGVDGFIFPDLPTHEFTRAWKPLLEEHQLAFSFLVTPETSAERVKLLDDLSTGFLYAVSSSSTTGTDQSSDHKNSTIQYLQSLKNLNLKNPVLAGFGIKNKQDYDFINEYVDGAIIGSAFIKHLSSQGSGSVSIKAFVDSIKS